MPGAGRKAGGKNKATLEAELAAAQSQLVLIEQQREADRAGRGRKPAVDVLDDIMHAGYGLMAKHQPLEPGEAIAPGSGREPDDAKFHLYLDITKDAAKALAPFQAPKFKSVVIGVDPSLTAAVAGGALAPGVPGTTERLSPAQAYRQLRDADVIDMAPAKPTPAAETKKAKRA